MEGTSSVERSSDWYRVIRTLSHVTGGQDTHTHAIFDDFDKRHFMFTDYITYQGVTQDVAEQLMLQDPECLFRKSPSSLEKFGFPTPNNAPTELEEAITLWLNHMS
jgi:hypothetical protein